MPTLAENRKARHDYQILETLEAGLVLTGPEVKSAKGGRANLQGAYVIPKGNELWITGMNIAAYPPAHGVQTGYDPVGDRKLLLKKSELSYLVGKLKEQGLTLVPISLYTAHSLVKISLGIARGKTKYDKRVSIRKREVDRELRSNLKVRI